MTDYAWWNQPETVETVTIISRDLVDQFPEHKIISVGQSPAWITLGAGMIRRLRGEDANIGFIPFTGNFMDNSGDEPIRYRKDGKIEHGLARTFTTNADKVVEPEVSEKYQEYLTKLKLSPQDLVMEMEQGQKFLFCDLTITGRGLASFMSEWSKNTSPEVCQFLGRNLEALAFTPKGQEDKTHFKVNDDLVVPIHNYVMGFERYEDMVYTHPSENKTDATSTRLVATYQLYATPVTKVGLQIPHNAAITRQIKAALHGNIQEHEQKGWSSPELPEPA